MKICIGFLGRRPLLIVAYICALVGVYAQGYFFCFHVIVHLLVPVSSRVSGRSGRMNAKCFSLCQNYLKIVEDMRDCKISGLRTNTTLLLNKIK